MSTYYLDTSAAVKLYVTEIGSNWLAQLLAPEQGPVVLSSQLLRVELQSAFARRLREGSVTPDDYHKMTRWVVEHCHMLYRFVPLNEAIMQRACALLEQHPLRSFDALHLATALTVNEQLVAGGEAGLIFLGADERLNEAVSATGLNVDNPNNYP